jgi:hypothetical protein
MRPNLRKRGLQPPRKCLGCQQGLQPLKVLGLAAEGDLLKAILLRQVAESMLSTAKGETEFEEEK